MIKGVLSENNIKGVLSEGQFYFIAKQIDTPDDNGIMRIICQQDSYKLGVGELGGKLYFSDDCGGSWPYLHDFADTTLIRMAWVFKNGNILFATKDNKIYSSIDNLTSINEITVKNPGGNVCHNWNFAQDIIWIREINWSWELGYAIATNITTEVLYQSCLKIGETYETTYTVSDLSIGGKIRIRCGSGTTGTYRYADGTYTEELTCSGNTNLLFESGGTLSSFKLNNVWARKLTGDDPDLVFHTPVNDSHSGIYFGVLHPESFIIGDKEILIWGSYWQPQDESGVAPNMLFCSVDNGLTVKVVYRFGDNPTERDDGTASGGATGLIIGDPDTVNYCHHVHHTCFDENTDKFYIQIGDDLAEIGILEGDYNIDTDEWNFSWHPMNVAFNVFRMTGLRMKDNNTVLWVCDSGSKGGIYTCDISNLFSIDLDNHEQLYVSPANPRSDCIGLTSYDSFMFTGRYNSTPAIVCGWNNGESWFEIPDNVFLANSSPNYWKTVRKIWNKDDNGYYLIVHNSLASQCVADSILFKITNT